MRASLLGFLLLSSFSFSTPPARAESPPLVGGRGRSLLELRETKGNASFQCSPSGPCIPCFYSEKNNEKYRCSETGYRVPLKCVEIKGSSKEMGNSKQRRLYSDSDVDDEANTAVHNQLVTVVRKLKWRRLLDDSSSSEGGKQTYITYRSCVPVEGEEKLSVIGFEYLNGHSQDDCPHLLKYTVDDFSGCSHHSSVITRSIYNNEHMIMVGLLLISGPVVYMRQRRTSVMPGVGAVRIPSNSQRF